MPQYTYNGVTCTATRRRPSSRDDKKYMRTVTYRGDTRLVHYGDPNMEMQRDNPERREAFLTRHSCDTKKDPFAPGFWSCYDWANTDEKSEPVKSITQPLKVIEATDDNLVLEGYVAIFGDEQHRDFDGEYFHDGTKFDSGYTKVNSLIVDWEHGQEPDMDDNGAALNQPGRHDPLGVLDWTTARNDGVGILARAVLNRREWYVKELVEPLAMARMLGGSSEAIPGKVVKSGGRIDVWPLMRYALTVTPADPRQITDHQIQLVKSLASRYPALKALTEPQSVSVSSVWTSGSTVTDGVTTHGNTLGNTWVILPGYVPPHQIKMDVSQVLTPDNTEKQPDESTPEAEPTQEGEQLQTDGAPVTATPEDETAEGKLTPEQETLLLERVEALLHVLQETEL